MNSSLQIAFLGLLVQVAALRAAPLFVSQLSVNPSPPYASWATAATNIQQAVDASGPGDFIVVSNGVYAAPLVVTKPVWVLSFAGAQFTRIDGHLTNQCVWMTNNARLDGFTIADGRAENGGGIWCTSTNDFVTNCIIIGNVASNQGGGVWGGTLGRCTLSNNSAGAGGGAAYARVENTVVTHNTSTAAGGGGLFECAANNCLLAGNSASAGGGAFGGTLSNCTLSRNEATSGGGADSADINNSILFLNSAPTGENVNACTL
ncbi:MAG TPA: hypothetical protein VHI52_22965, partial [Verrucomicrobiae bacterium]|nr:hypothetical protein [Verrucomicrobiae bacterium]